MKFLIVIILFVQEMNYFFTGIVLSGGLGAGGKWLVGAQNSVPVAGVREAASHAEIGFHGTVLPNSLFLSLNYW